ncbi:stage III sporulation protein AH [Priestia megaterium]
MNMLLKKQTVWLLTMLSLVVVLSVYYMTTPENPQSNVALVDNEKQSEKQADDKAPAEDTKQQVDEKSGTKEDSKTEGSAGDVKKETAKNAKESAVVSSTDSDELFTALRLELNDERSQLKEEYQEVAASKNVTPAEVSKAMDKIDELSKLGEKEATLETLIKAKGYSDALVRADGKQVQITVKTEKHSKTKANQIIQLVKKEMGPKEVAVEFQPTK